MEKSFETEVLTRLAVIESKLDEYTTIKDKTEKAFVVSEQNREEIKNIKDNNKWLFRTTIGAFITSIIALLLGILIKMK